ncbi:MAG TPA: flagellar export protein FliJ [Spongiibacteraceae bacterium]|jgi:flagellar export protein FliJ|nr:flagellar export protein FliJ [Spongiibacteraceae bacterium]
MARRKRSEQLAAALKLAALREQQAARKLGVQQQGLRQLEAQAEQLDSYRKEYRQQFLKAGSQGLDAQALRNYQGFFQNLAQADTLQAQRIEQARQQRSTLLAAWTRMHWRRKVMADLVQRRRTEEDREQEKRAERLQNDELRRPVDPDP